MRKGHWSYDFFMAWLHLAFTQSPILSTFNLNFMYCMYYSYCYVYNRISMQLSIIWTIPIFSGGCSHVHVCKLNCEHQILNLKFQKSDLAYSIFAFVVMIFGLTNNCQKGSFYFIMAFLTIFDFSVNDWSFVNKTRLEAIILIWFLWWIDF